MENNRRGPAQIKCQERPEMKMITKEKTNDDIPDRGNSRSKGIELGKNSLNTSWVFRDLERDGQGESTPDDGKERGWPAVPGRMDQSKESDLFQCRLKGVR